MKRTELHTERLVLRRWQAADLDPLAAICADPQVMAYIGDGSVRTVQQVGGFIEQAEAAWRDQGYGLFAVELHQTGEMIGFTGLSRPTFMPELLPATEIGWRLGKAHWGQGYATEAAMAALTFARTLPVIDQIVSICQTGNLASVRIMEKIGLNLDRRGIDPSCNRDVFIYRLPR